MNHIGHVLVVWKDVKFLSGRHCNQFGNFQLLCTRNAFEVDVREWLNLINFKSKILRNI